jgi:hypothetical protein
MDRAVFDSVEREIDDEVRARFPGDVIKQAVLLHYGDDPEIEPGELWVRVLLRADRREEYEQILVAFDRDHQAALEEFLRYLAETLREIRLVEFTFPDNPVTSGGHGPRRSWIVGIAIICDNFSPHLTTRKDRRVGAWAKANNVEIAYTPTNSSWLNRIEAQFTALRYFTLDGTDHAGHKEQASMIRRYIIWRNNHAYDERLRRIVDRANVA